MKYKVITASFDVTQYPPRVVHMIDSDRQFSVEIIDTDDNVLFADCENVHDIEDGVLQFWNRLNPSSSDGPNYTHNPREKVVVVHVEPVVSGGDA